MDTEPYKLPFQESGLTGFLCPRCEKGRLRVKKDTVHCEETQKSRTQHANPQFEPDSGEYVYCCLLECINEVCEEVVASTGIGVLSLDVDFQADSPRESYVTSFWPQYFSPWLKVFRVPEETPLDVASEIDRSFALFFADPPSAANHLRIALERILTCLKVRRYNNSKGKRHIVRLHDRIGLLPPRYEKEKDLFLAIKWIGNAGSHSEEKLSCDDVLHAYTVMELLLAEIFISRHARPRSLAKSINKYKGPLRI
ncbi:DUF4145 domain-containing protein [uncultured Lamprocystis sp.]|uniref:DUF4145 domain-containing protein n=1 Tax=uncultured Lamprocystis sp. TaxID=543132 RepID=UPI0025F43E45|nr:DUF4145 domain-containing protein [uncultured Lamprocystis sp.]